MLTMHKCRGPFNTPTDSPREFVLTELGQTWELLAWPGIGLGYAQKPVIKEIRTPPGGWGVPSILSVLRAKSGPLSVSLAPKAPEIFEVFSVLGHCF